MTLPLPNPVCRARDRYDRNFYHFVSFQFNDITEHDNTIYKANWERKKVILDILWLWFDEKAVDENCFRLQNMHSTAW